MATLQGKTILIIGGSAGIGYGIAEASIKSSAKKVIIASSSKERVDTAVKTLNRESGATEVLGLVVDAKKPESIQSLMNDAGEIDHLIFTSGDPLHIVDLREANIEEVKGAFDVRLWAPLLSAKYAKIKPEGSIIFTIGSVIKKPRPKWSFIAAGTGALEAATRALAIELAPIRVNIVAPGLVITDLWDYMPEAERQDMYKTIGENSLVKHTGTIQEVAEAYLFLMKCTYITGETIHVNGGITLM